MKKLALSFLIALILFSCGKSKSSQNDMDFSELEDIVLTNENTIYQHDLVCDIEAIPLESSDKVLIGNIDHIILTEEYIIVCDSRTSKSVYVFDRNGKHHSTINRVGRGPQEYIAIHHVALLPDNETIAINDNNSGKVLYFTLDGTFITAKPVPFRFIPMEYIDDDNVICITYGQGKSDPGLAELDHPENLVFFTDKKYNIRDGFLPSPYDRDKFNFQGHIIKKFDNDIYVNITYTDLIYKVENRGLKPMYRLNLDKIGGVSLLDPNITNEEFYKLNSEKTTFSGDFIITDDYITFSVWMPDLTLSPYLYSKKTKKIYLAENDGKQGNTLFLYLLVTAKTQKDNKFVTSMPAHMVMNMGKKLIEMQPELAEIKEDDNPAIVLYRFKEGL